MPEITLLHIGAATAAAIIGIVLGWTARGSRATKEKSAINAGWQEQLEAKNVESGRLETQNKNLMEQVSRFQSADHGAAKQVKELTAEVKDSRELRDRLERQVEGLRGQLKRATDDLNQLNVELRARPDGEAAKAAVDEVIQRHKQKIESLNKALLKWQGRVPPLVAKYRERDETVTRLESELAEAERRIAALESDDEGDKPADNETEGNVVSFSVAGRKRAQAAEAEADSEGNEESDEDEAADDASDDADLIDVGESLDSQIVEAAAAEDALEDGETDDEYTIDGTRLDIDDPLTSTFAGPTDDDTGQSRFDGGRTRIDPDGSFAAEDEIDDGDEVEVENDGDAQVGAAAEVAPDADIDDSLTREGPSVAGLESAADAEPEPASADASDDEPQEAPADGGPESLDFGAYVDYPDDEAGEGLRDNLKRINGIGPAIEKTLNELGLFRYRQIADLTDYDFDRIEKRLSGFRSRIQREDWMGQARELIDQTAGETA